VTIYYAWTAADTQANFHRVLADEANKIQSRYHFVFDTKPGAGGSIAANHVLNSSNSLLATSSAFYVRPNFFPNESHDISKFRLLFPQCAAPAAVTSRKFTSWDQVPVDRAISIGVSGMGTTTHLIAHQITARYPLAIIVPFKSTTEAILGVVSDSVDLAVNFLGESAQYVEQKRLTVLGVTGSQAVAGHATLSSQGFAKNLEAMTIPAQILAPNNFPESKVQEIRSILRRAGQRTSVTDSYKVDFCLNNNQMSDNDIATWFVRQTTDWRRITQGVSLK
jgi:tripartite-type tricarboxylate transporter receptor subunit TctC